MYVARGLENVAGLLSNVLDNLYTRTSQNRNADVCLTLQGRANAIPVLAPHLAAWTV